MNASPIVLITVAFFVLTLFSAPAAEAREQAVAVRLNDLDLHAPGDARRLLRRLEGAAGRVCDATLSAYHPAARRAFMRCRGAVIGEAVTRINSMPLRRAYEARYRR